MKLPPARIAAFLRTPDPAVRAALVYGPDNGLVRERADLLARAVAQDPADPFRVADLAAAAVASDPARLNDEAAAQSLTGGRRLIRIRDAGDAIGKLLSSFLAAPPPGDSLVLVEGGDLGPRSSLRTAFERAAAGVTIACYADGPREIEELVRSALAQHRITASPDAAAHLVAHLGNDRLVSRQELEKLALYIGDGGKVEIADAMLCVGDSTELTLEDVVYAAADGDAASLERALTRAFQEGEAPVTILRATTRHFQRLHLAGCHFAESRSMEDALRSLRPPLHFKLRDRFQRQLRVWTPGRAETQLVALTEAERNAKRTGLPAEVICSDALLRAVRTALSARR
jgi:DNA polymerase-3 subunit delta